MTAVVPKKVAVDITARAPQRKNDEDNKRQRLASGEISPGMDKMRASWRRRYWSTPLIRKMLSAALTAV